MRATRDRSHVNISLFPFLSVLACVTGTLSFLISGMSSIILGDSPQVIDMTPTGTNKTPRYVECRSDGIIIHPDGELLPVSDIERPDSAFYTLLKEARDKRRDQCVILLIRPDGIETYQSAKLAFREFAEAAGVEIDLGYDAVYAAGPIQIRSPVPGARAGGRP